MLSSSIELISRRLGKPDLTSSDEVRFNCFTSNCGALNREADTGKHLYVNPKKERYFCHRCQKGGTLQYLSKILDLPAVEDEVTLWTKVINEFLYGITVTSKKVEKLLLPSDFEPIISGTKAYKYLISRGITQEQVEYYNIGFGTKALKNRIIFPDYDKNGELIYWVARTYGKHKAKYKNAKVSRVSKVYNIGRWLFSSYEQVIICEGPISAIITGYDAIACYGKYISPSQIELISSLPCKEFIVALDGDATVESIRLGTCLARKGLNVRIVKFLYDEDPALIGYDNMRKRINDALPYDLFSLVEVL